MDCIKKPAAQLSGGLLCICHTTFSGREDGMRMIPGQGFAGLNSGILTGTTCTLRKWNYNEDIA
jgi:hypothetical protein